MRRVIGPLLFSALLIAGCGSSARPTGPGATTASSATTTPNGSHLSVIGTPKFGSPSSSSPVLSGVVPVTFRYFAVDPEVIRVRAGSTIVWTNEDRSPENVTSIGGSQRIASKDFGHGATFRLRLTRQGVIHYESSLHPATINGTIEVLR